MPQKAEVLFSILDSITMSPDGRKRTEIAADTGITDMGLLASHLDNMRKAGYVETSERGLWHVTPAGQARLDAKLGIIEEPSSAFSADLETPSAPPGAPGVEKILPSEYDKFYDIGKSLGLRGDFLKSACEHVFTGEVHDLGYVWIALNELFLRPDVTKRWYNLWARSIRQPVPPELFRTAGSTVVAGQAGQPASPFPPQPKLYSLIGDQIMLDPEGDLTYMEAIKLLAVQKSGVPAEKTSEVIAALTPYLVREPAPPVESKGESVAVEVLREAVKVIGDTRVNQGQGQGITLADLITLIDKFKTEPPVPASVLDEVERVANVFDKFKNLFGGGQPSNPTSPVYVTLGGQGDGQSGAVPLEAYLKIDDHRWQRHKESEELNDKRENAGAVRDFLGRIARAAGKFAETEGE